jgi:hypothetical protein
MRVRIETTPFTSRFSDRVVATRVLEEKSGRELWASDAHQTAEEAVDSAWGWADRHGHVVVEA